MNRKTNLLVFLTTLMLLGMSCAVTSCNDDDENSGLGSQQVAYLKGMVLDEKGKVFFDPTNTSGVYKIGLPTKDAAKELVELYVGSGFNGQSYTRTLDDNKGMVVVNVNGDGVFYTVRFEVKGIPEFALNLVDEGSNSIGTKHTCSVCGYVWIGYFPRCPKTGDKDYHPQK